MRIKAITPIHVTEDELARRQERYDRLAPPGMKVTVVNLPDREDVPRTLSTRLGIMSAAPFVYAEGMRTNPDEFDAILVDCVLDPAVEELTADQPLPVYGPLRLTLSLLHGLGHRFATVTRNDPIAEAMFKRISDYGFADMFDSSNPLHLSFEEIANPTVWNAALQGVLDKLEAKGNVQALINGCSAVDVDNGKSCVRVLDPARTALQMIALGAQL